MRMSWRDELFLKYGIRLLNTLANQAEGETREKLRKGLDLVLEAIEGKIWVVQEMQ